MWRLVATFRSITQNGHDADELKTTSTVVAVYTVVTVHSFRWRSRYMAFVKWSSETSETPTVPGRQIYMDDCSVYLVFSARRWRNQIPTLIEKSVRRTILVSTVASIGPLSVIEQFVHDNSARFPVMGRRARAYYDFKNTSRYKYE